MEGALPTMRVQGGSGRRERIAMTLLSASARLWRLSFLLVALLAAGACQSTPGPTASASATTGTGPAATTGKGPATVVRICNPITLGHPASTALADAMKAEAELLSASGQVKIVYDVFDTKGDPPTEIKLIENCIASKYDVIALIPSDGEAVVPVTQQAAAAGIYVINFANNVGDAAKSSVTTYIGATCADSGVAAIGTLIPNVLGGPGKASGNVVEIQGAPGHPCALARGDPAVWQEMLAREPGIKLIASETGQWDRAVSQTVMENFLTAYPDIDLVYTHDTSMAFGAISAIQAAGKKPGIDIKVITINGTKEEFEAIKAGTLNGTVYLDFKFMARNVIQRARDVVEGMPVLSEISSPR